MRSSLMILIVLFTILGAIANKPDFSSSEDDVNEAQEYLEGSDITEGGVEANLGLDTKISSKFCKMCKNICKKGKKVKCRRCKKKCKKTGKSIWIGPGAGSDGESEVLSMPKLRPIPGCHVPTYPLPSIQGSVAQVIDYKTLHVCGGLVSSGTGHGGSSSMLSTCYNYTKGQTNWKKAESMAEARWGAASVQLEDASFWVTGGYNTKILNSTEIWNAGSWTSSIDLPIALEFHCMVQINTTHSFISGGWTDTGGQWGSVTGATWIYDGNGNFARQQNMTTKRFNHGCALYGGEIWVVGGQENFSGQLSSSEVFDLITLKWETSAPALPVPTSGGQLHKIKGTLLFIGGVVGEGNQKTQTKNIYKLKDGLNWTKTPVAKMKTKRAHFNALEWKGCK